ncbi:hypothetical protein PFICI_06853 [Pestalotiopsis fici W106-1]|uniref:Flo11 n=1 Tax=Pestalotiopsis fici (strain W106-1 / CGMCC3.15140) TaxID=1229662 RepID=W3X9K8_PESFW|nr:uncharacterized protein PFICI_06853 [Pestalotiopsis fici W106-1]ETS81851.1 hypothetical protein PFICI_06853 [Pestalotiopsis fici W106-1]
MSLMMPTAGADTNVSGSPLPLQSPRNVRSRTQSLSSDRPSTIAHSLMSPPSAVTPEAAFIAASAASQIVTSDCDSSSEAWFDQFGIEPSSETAMVTVNALQLANNFIDQLLFNIIGVAGSTSLAALRPAVSEVLKPKLAKDAISAADDELNEYLGGGEVDDLVQSAITGSPDDWDLELVWKRTRLRCMVYSSLGDMEEEDEDYHMEQEHLGVGDGDDHPESAVSPAVAIFLTSILEFMGEQVLIVAGQAALNRLRMRYEKDLKDGTRASGDESERIVVEELDMERVALDRTLGRLWRSWKKRIRSPTEPNFGRNSIRSATHSRRGSAATDAMQSLATPLEESMPREAEDSNVKPRPSQIPLPIGSNDVAEIEVPGLVAYSDDEDSDLESDEDAISLAPRPKSLMFFSALAYQASPALGLSEPQAPAQKTRRRSSSVPTPAALPYKSPIAVKVDDNDTDVVVTDVNKAADVSGLKVERQVNEDGVSPLDTSSTDYLDGRSAAVEPSPVSAIVSTAAALGAAAVAGVAAMVQGSAPQTEPEPTPIDEDEIDDFGEEPEIMTSSRVSINGSIGGRSSPSVPESGRPLSIKLPARSNSLRSVRVIDVQSPRTPSIKSRAGSVDTSDVPPSRPTSSTPPIAEERASPDNLTARAIKNALAGAAPAEGALEYRNARDYSHPQTSTYESFKPPVSNAVPAASSRMGPTSAPAAYGMKASARNQSNAGRSFLDLDSNKPEIPDRAPEHHRMPRMPVVPEQSAPAPASPTYTRKRSADRNQPGAPGSPESARAAPTKLNDSPSSSSSNKYKPMRSSEDGSQHRPQDITKNFEELLQNDQTIQYTLTPENMRNMDPVQRQTNGGPTSHHKSRRSEDVKLSEQPRSSSSMSIKRSMSVSKATGLSSHPLGSHPMENQSVGKASKLTGPVPRAPPVSMGNYHNRASAQARDARVPRESVADFADFIRSTGPPGGKPAPAKAPPSHAAHGRSASGTVAPSASVELNRSRQGSVNRARLQARDAAVSASNESSDLIDFIRRGPPNAGNNPRIPRNVAPFRTTMDSDQMQMSGAGGGKAVDAVIPDVRHSRASTTVTDTSLPSSINSNSALLNKANKPAQYSNNFDDDDMMPKRKQRRVRDPYAIDFSDEEDEFDELEGDGLGRVETQGVNHIKEEELVDDDDDFDLDLAPRPKPRKEESLIDFLNNCEPPSAPSPPRPFVTSQAMPKKKASAPNLISRLRSAGGNSSSAAKSNGISTNQPRAVSSQGGNPRGYTPINVTIPSGAATSYGSIQPPAPRVNNNPSGGRVLMKKYEPRDASSSAGLGRTSDLASFLRDSEPPPSTMASPVAQSQEKSSSGFSRVFERRKKSVY